LFFAKISAIAFPKPAVAPVIKAILFMRQIYYLTAVFDNEFY
jgi:hypothetical protein